MRNLVGVESEDIAAIDKRVILVSDDLSPADTCRINLARIMGFITNRGGKTSHTGIMAQALEIPAVVGLVNVTATIKNEDLIIVDGGTASGELAVALTGEIPHHKSYNKNINHRPAAKNFCEKIQSCFFSLPGYLAALNHNQEISNCYHFQHWQHNTG